MGYCAEVVCLFNHSPITIWEPQSSLEHGKLEKSFFTSSCLCLRVSKARFPCGRDRTKMIDEGVGVRLYQAQILTQSSDPDLSLPPEYPRHHGCWLPGMILSFSCEIFYTLSNQLNNPWVSQRLLCLGSSRFQDGLDSEVHSPSPSEYI